VGWSEERKIKRRSRGAGTLGRGFEARFFCYWVCTIGIEKYKLRFLAAAWRSRLRRDLRLKKESCIH